MSYAIFWVGIFNRYSMQNISTMQYRIEGSAWIPDLYPHKIKTDKSIRDYYRQWNMDRNHCRLKLVQVTLTQK